MYSSLTRDLNLISRFKIDIEGEKVLGLKRQPANLVFFTSSRIGFAKVHEKTVISSFCESVIYQCFKVDNFFFLGHFPYQRYIN